MAKKDPRVDQYIARSAEFARPILKRLRKVVHAACPAVEETMKWSVPHFDYRGEMMCGMAAFKEHCTFGFWKGDLVMGGAAKRDAMGHLGRITSLADLPADATLARYVRKAMQLNDAGVKAPHLAARRPRPALAPPDDLLAALAKNRPARVTFEAFSPSHKREYIEWITEAKTAATRSRRLETAVGWMAEGRERNWKYAR